MSVSSGILAVDRAQFCAVLCDITPLDISGACCPSVTRTGQFIPDKLLHLQTRRHSRTLLSLAALFTVCVRNEEAGARIPGHRILEQSASNIQPGENIAHELRSQHEGGGHSDTSTASGTTAGRGQLGL
jgi:hypothetical protein